MKKLAISVMLLMISANSVLAQDENSAQYLNKDFFNKVISDNGFSEYTSVLDVDYATHETIEKYSAQADILVKQSEKNSLSFNVIFKGVEKKIHVFLLADGYNTLSFIESSDKISKPIYTNIRDGYNYSYGFENLANNSNRVPCGKGAAQVQAAGSAIAFGTFFGCGPCLFVGGAIGLLGTIGAALCP